MSLGYDQYLEQHRNGVKKGFEWISNNLPYLLDGADNAEWYIMNHDNSKEELDEYEAYDAYFYGHGRSYKVVQDFNKAWLLHIHRNPHHWQYWVLINDNPDEGEIILEMDYVYILEMICDWWSFSWSKGNLNEIFSWYEQHKDYMKLGTKTRETVENILADIKKKLEEVA